MADPVTYDQMERLLQNQAQTFAGLVGKGGSGAAPSSGGGDGGSSIKGLDTTIAKLIGGLDKASTGASAFGQVVNTVAETIAKGSPALGAAFSAVAGKVTGTANTMQQFTDKGALLGGRLQEFGVNIAASGGNTQAFMANVATLGKGIQGIGETTGQGVQNLAKFTADFQKTPLAKQMADMGMSIDQINQVAAVSLANSQYKDISDEKARKKAVAGAEEFAGALLVASNTTGKNTQTILQENQARTESNDVMGEIMLQGPEMQEAYDRLKKTTMDMGPALQSMTDEMFATGIKTEESAAKMSALGPAGVELEKAVELQRNARTEGEKKEADAAMARAKAMADDYMKSKEFIKLMQYDKTSETGRAANQLFSENKARLAGQNIAAQQNVQEGRPGDSATARQRQEAATAAAVNMKDMKTGQKPAGAETYQAIVNTDNKVRAEMNALTAEGFKKFGGALDSASARLNNSFKGAATTPGAAVAAKETGQQPGKPKRVEREEGSPGAEQLTSSLKGNWNSVLEKFSPKGTPALLHKEEVVLNKTQWERLGEVVESKMTSMTKPAEAPVSKGGDVVAGVQDALGGMKAPKIDSKQIADLTKSMPQMDTKSLENATASMSKGMPDIASKMGDFFKTSINPEKIAGASNDMLKNLSTSMPDMVKNVGKIGLPNPSSMLGGLKGNFNSLTAELSTSQREKDIAAKDKENPIGEMEKLSSGNPSQDLLAGMLEKLNTGIANVGGLLQQGNEIASSASSKLEMDNRFAI